MGDSSVAKILLLALSTLFSLAGVSLFFPQTTEFVFISAATRSSLALAREYNVIIGAVLIFTAAVLCSTKPGKSTLRSITAGSAVVTVAACWLVFGARTISHVSIKPPVLAAIAGVFGTFTVAMLLASSGVGHQISATKIAETPVNYKSQALDSGAAAKGSNSGVTTGGAREKAHKHKA
jgi:hypothetical protein